jgi:hypothetical protein
MGYKRYAIKNGIPEKDYNVIHSWLSKKYGKANKCENELCDNKSLNYQWALKKGFQYKKDRECFIMLCISCHKKYDWKEEYSERLRNRIVSDETKEKLRLASTGVAKSLETLKKLSEANSGTNNPMYGVHITGENHSWWGKHHTEESKEKMLIKNGKVNKEQVLEIRQLVADGKKQKDIALIYGISRAAICRIIKNKRYKQW